MRRRRKKSCRRAAHEDKMRNLEIRQKVYTDTIAVIKETDKELRNIKE